MSDEMSAADYRRQHGLGTTGADEEITLDEYRARLRAGGRDAEIEARAVDDEASRQGHRTRAIGAVGEQIVEAELRRRGVRSITAVGKAAKIITIRQGGRALRVGGRQAYHVIFAERLAGDYHGLYNGRGVRVEVKTHTGSDRLRHSALRAGQAESLSEFNDDGGIALLAWVTSEGVAIMRWPIDGFVSGTSLALERALTEQWYGDAEK